jgi:hypothetical protein
MYYYRNTEQLGATISWLPDWTGRETQRNTSEGAVRAVVVVQCEKAVKRLPDTNQQP